MSFKLVSYELLKQNIQESISTEIISHNLNPADLKRALKSLRANSFQRAIQCQYLLAVSNCLEAAEIEEDKMLVLNAAVYYVREQIKDSYQLYTYGVSFFSSPENSTLYNSLTTSLNITNQNSPDPEDVLEMYTALEGFMRAQVYQDPDTGKVYREDHSFSEEKIKGYKVESSIKDLVQKTSRLKQEQIDASRAQHVAKEKKSKIKVFGMFSANASAAAVSGYRDEQLEVRVEGEVRIEESIIAEPIKVF